MKRVFAASILLLAMLMLAPIARPVAMAEKASPKSGATLARLFIQDLDSSSLMWTEIRVHDNQTFQIDSPSRIEGLKAIDSKRQKLVQMKETGGTICLGIRDDADGKFESGWVLIRSGVDFTDHGDHGHWGYKNKPELLDQRLDAFQGNPAHVYLYNKCFFIANDRINGYTRIDPSKYEGTKKDTPRFLVGGGNHITLATVEDRVGYSAWIDGGGPNKGRIDVTPITGATKTEPAYQFSLPTGGIHGAIANSGKVFFAPMDGICWVSADLDAKLKADQVKVNHISLGKEGDKPCRTGAFTNFLRYVVFATGKSESPRLVLLDAKEDEPKPIELKLPLRKGLQMASPEVVLTAKGTGYAFIFQDRTQDSDADEYLDIVELDPNEDGDCRDMKLFQSIKVGKSCVDGHFGHHAIAFDAEKRYGFISNPGDGTISVLSLKNLQILATLQVGGKPGALVAVGSRESSH